jgi:hypothetical protein
VAGALIIGAVFGYVLRGGPSSADPRVLATLAACESKLEKARSFFTAVPAMKSFTGTVERVAGNVVIVTIPPSGNPFDEYPTAREVVVDSTTEFVVPGAEAQLGVEDIAVGERITVVADHDVKLESRFTATTIQVTRTPEGATPPPTPPPKPVR